MAKRGICVLVVDDSVVVRQAVKAALAADPAIERVEVAANGLIALRKIEQLDPDVVTLDVEMPKMNGLATLRRIMRRWPRPVIMFSGHTSEGAARTLQALELGAVDFLHKPGGQSPAKIDEVAVELLAKVKALAPARQRLQPAASVPPSWPASQGRQGPQPAISVPPGRPAPQGPEGAAGPAEPSAVVAIGASTGGTEALRTILTALPASFPAGVLVVQHMPPEFTTAFAKRLDELCALTVKEAAHRDVIYPGRVLLAPGHSHMLARWGEGLAYVELSRRPAVSGHRPSVDVLFHSVAEAFGAAALAVICTGMGRDGAEGMLEIHRLGGVTIAQDEASSVVFGMPRAAVEEGGVQQVLPLQCIAGAVRRAVKQ